MHGEAWNRLQGMTDALANSGLVVVDKPQGMTSHDVVSRLRRIFHTRKVGHAGTLDPMATGVLVVGLERGTKFLAHMVASTKSYDATIRLGMATHTDDAEGERIWGEPASELDMEQVKKEVAALTGDLKDRVGAGERLVEGERKRRSISELVEGPGVIKRKWPYLCAAQSGEVAAHTERLT